MRQWRSFLSNIASKTSLIDVMVSEWKKAAYREKLGDKILYVTVDETCHRITSEDRSEHPSLWCSQEEADGHSLLHAAHATKKGFEAVVYLF